MGGWCQHRHPFSAAAAGVLSSLSPAAIAYFNGQAQEAAMSRLNAGIHYRSDIMAGLEQGQRLAAYTIHFAQKDGAD